MKLTPCGWAFLRAEPQVGVRKKQTIKHTPNMLRIAIQAKGRLNEQSIDLLSEAGIRVAESKRKLISRAEGFPLEVLYLRDDDIQQAVAMGVPGVQDAHHIRTRGTEGEVYADLHVLVAPGMTVGEAHELSERVERAIMQRFPNVIEVLVHIEPNDGHED